ncbi:MAG: PIG-L family deacetylase [Anaerolineae bacterium]|nr:PIG-L family deacetylase [Anaerolineae bacterium]
MSETPASYIPKRVLAVVAHPDDIEFSFAGTIAKWTQAGATACYVLCTDGDAGFTQPGITRRQAAEIRRIEQTAAAKVLGVREVVFLGYPDGLLVNNLELRKHLVRQIRRFKPDTLVTLHPTVVFVGDGYINHPDHRACGQAALDATFPAAAMRLVFPELEGEGLEPHRVRHVYVSTWHEANTYIDITDTIDLKICALKEHKSQVNRHDIGERLRQWAAERGKAVGLTYAESFRYIALPAGEAEKHAPPEEELEEEPCEEVPGPEAGPAVIRIAGSN